MVLKDSFIKLLEKKDISKISIKEICEDADINRATFYAHYNDQYDFMKRIQDDLLENIENYLTVYTKNEPPTIPVDSVEHIFEYIKENARLCKLLLSDRGDLNFQKRVLMLVYEKNMIDLIRNGVTSKEDAEYTFAFILTGCVGVIQKWLNDDMVKSPRYMAEIIIKLTNTDVPKNNPHS
jgi:AcrR family transcriptional regulator